VSFHTAKHLATGESYLLQLGRECKRERRKIYIECSEYVAGVTGFKNEWVFLLAHAAEQCQNSETYYPYTVVGFTGTIVFEESKVTQAKRRKYIFKNKIK